MAIKVYEVMRIFLFLTLAFFSVFNCLAGYVFRCNIPGENGKTVRMQFNTLNDSQCEVYNSYPSSAFDYYGDASISKSTVGAIHIPDSVSYNNRFYKVVGIQNGSFYGCSKLSAVYIPETVGYIGDQVFAYCSELQTVSLPESVTKIGKEAFYKCSQLESIYIPKSVEFIGVDAFNYCSALNGVYITDIASWCNISFAISVYDGKLFSNPLHYAHNLYLNETLVTNLVIPEGVKTIKNRAFDFCSSIQNVVIPSSLEAIGGCAFYGCQNIKSVEIKNLSSWCRIRLGYDRYSSNNVEEYTSNPLYYGAVLKYNGNKIDDLVIPNDITSINTASFIKQSFNTVILHNNIQQMNNTYLCTNYLYSEAKIDISFNNNIGELWDFPKNKRYYHSGSVTRSDSIITSKVTTLTTITMKAIENFVFEKIIVNESELSTSNSVVELTDLLPQTTYNISAKGRINGVNHTFEVGVVKIKTAQLFQGGISVINATQTKLDLSYIINRDFGFFPDTYGLEDFYGNYIVEGRIKDFTADSFIIGCEISGLIPDHSYSFRPWAMYNGVKFYGDYTSIMTKSIDTNFKGKVGPTSVNYTGTYSAGDAHVTDAYFTFQGKSYKKLLETGLEPGTQYSYSYTVRTSNGNQYQSYSFKTSSLQMQTQTARMLTNTTAMLMAETNMADEETSCGFEWRRYDAPAEMPSTKVYCPVYGGTMAGTLKNLSENVYYKYRPFYKSSKGNEYYGDWIAFITADAGVEFEPVVYTYSSPEVSQTEATLQGVALRGSDDITEQGFEYWQAGRNNMLTASNVKKVTAKGERMSATVTGLQPGTAYKFRAYAIAGGKTTRGAEVDFVTESTGLDVNADGVVNIADMNVIINVILRGNNDRTCDVNGDGMVNISDLNAIISAILAN